MATEMRRQPTLTAGDARKFIEREQQVDSRRKEILNSGKTPQVKKGLSFCTSAVKN